MSSLAVAYLLVGVIPVEAPRPLWADYTVISPDDTADDLWARALLVSSLSHAWPDAPDELAGRLFAEALHRADRHKRSQILVTMGEYGVASTFAASVRTSVSDAAAKSNEVVARSAETRETAESLAAVPAQAEALAGSLADENEGTTDEQFGAIADSLFAAVQRSQEQARSDAAATYIASLEADADNLAGWFRLVWVTQGNAQDAALAELRLRDPENALPWIATGVVLIERKDFPAAVTALRAAAERPFCRLYAAPLPERFGLRLPNDDTLQSWGIARHAVSATALLHLLRDWKRRTDSMGGRPWESRLREALGWTAQQHVAALLKAGMLRQAEETAEACHDAGLKLLSAEPPDVALFVAAVGVVLTTASAASDAHRLAAHYPAAEQFQRRIERWGSTRHQRSALAPDQPRDWLARVVRGEWDELAEWQAYMRNTREVFRVRASD